MSYTAEMDATLVHDHRGAPHRIHTDEKGRRYADQPCDRCGGEGGWAGWPGFTCYRCRGTGWDPNRARVYTPEERARRDRANERARERKHQAFLQRNAEWMAERAAREAERAAREAERQARYEAERLAAQDAPDARVEVTGEVLSTREREGRYGMEYKMLIKTDAGWKLWISVPRSLNGVERGTRVALTATVEPSRDDPKFAFGKRPTKARIVEGG